MTKIISGVIAAISAAIFVSFAVGGTLIAVMVSYHNNGSLPKPSEIAIAGSLVAGGSSFVAIPIIAILAVPCHRLVIRLGCVRGRDYTSAGAFAGFCLYLVFLIIGEIKSIGFGIPHQMAIPALVIGPSIGAFAAFGFWAVVRPDELAPE
jgi:hypothetical protein